MSLSRFVHESIIFDAIRKLLFFKNFRLVKHFYTWTREVRFKIFCNNKRSVTKNLFYAHGCYCATLMEMGA